MKIKKILAILTAASLVAVLCVALTGCGGKKAKYTVGICQLVQHDALDAATKGFKAALKEKLGDDVEFDEQNASGESANCSTIVNQFVSGNVDLIMANATGALQAAVSATDSIPIVATSVTDYATALQIDDWSGKTGINVTGTSDLAPLDRQAAMIKELVPGAKNVGILYCSGEANSKYQATVIAKHLSAAGLKTKEFTSADSNDLAQVVTAACAEVDVIYIPTDNTMASNTEIVNNIAEPARIPIIAGEAGICKGCGIATLSIDYYSLGFEAGEMAYEILVNGKNPADMEIGFASDLTKKYVASRCTALGITVPADYTEISD